LFSVAKPCETSCSDGECAGLTAAETDSSDFSEIETEESESDESESTGEEITEGEGQEAPEEATEEQEEETEEEELDEDEGSKFGVSDRMQQAPSTEKRWLFGMIWDWLTKAF